MQITETEKKVAPPPLELKVKRGTKVLLQMLKDRGYKIKHDEMSKEKIDEYWKDWDFGQGEQKQVKAETYSKLMTSDEDPEIAV